MYNILIKIAFNNDLNNKKQKSNSLYNDNPIEILRNYIVNDVLLQNNQCKTVFRFIQKWIVYNKK